MRLLKCLPSILFVIAGLGCGGSAEDARHLDLAATQSKSSYDRADYAGPARLAGPAATVAPERPRAVAGNVVLNSGFETGSTSWTQSSTAGYNLISSFSQYPAYAGTQYAWLGGYSDGTDTLYQDVTVPSSGAQAKLQFWQRISTEEISTSKAYDTLAIELYNPTTGAKLATLATLSNLNANTAWTQSPKYDLTAYKGQRVRIKFTATLDVTDNSSFRFDEVSVFPLDSTSNGSPQTGIWWNPSESGSGLVIEQQGSKILLGTFVYDDSGANTWYVSTLTKQTDGSFTGDVLRSAGGQSLTGTYRAPTSSTAVAKVTLSFASGTTGTLALQSTVGAVLRTISIERFPIVNPPFTTPSSSFERGFWWNESEAGRGFFIEVQGSQVLVSSFMYDALGQPVWYSGTAPLQSSQSFSIPLLQYANGQSLSGAYRAPSQSAGSAGNLQFTFDSATTGTMTLPNGRAVTMKRVVFDTSASTSTGSGTGSTGGATGSTGGSGTGSTATLASFAGTYTVATTDGTSGSFTVDASGNVTSCRVGVVVSCTGRLTFNSTTGAASFTISGNDGQNPVDTTATLSGTISSAGTVSGSYSASSVSEGSASGNLSGSKSSSSGSSTGSGTTTGSGSGTGSTTNGGSSTSPNFVSLAAGSDMVFGLTQSGDLWSWGTTTNSHGQIGNGSRTPVYSPVKIGTGYTSVSPGNGGDSYAMGVKSDGTLMHWGSDPLVAGATDVLTPRVLATGGFVFVGASTYYHVALKSDGTLWSWGQNSSGLAGDGTTTPIALPKQIGAGFAKVSPGTTHALAIKTDGSLWAWGVGTCGALGQKSGYVEYRVPTQIGTGYKDAVAVMGRNMSLAIKSDGTLWSWGQTYNGHLGNGISAAGCRYTPQQIGTNFVSIASGFSSAIGLKDDGTLWSWGHFSISSSKTGADSLVPKQIGSGFSSIYMGAWRAFAIALDGSLWSWGDAHDHGFGNTNTYASVPTKIK